MFEKLLKKVSFYNILSKIMKTISKNENHGKMNFGAKKQDRTMKIAFWALKLQYLNQSFFFGMKIQMEHFW